MSLRRAVAEAPTLATTAVEEAAAQAVAVEVAAVGAVAMEAVAQATAFAKLRVPGRPLAAIASLHFYLLQDRGP